MNHVIYDLFDESVVADFTCGQESNNIISSLPSKQATNQHDLQCTY